MKGLIMKLTMKDVFLIRTQEYKDVHYFLDKNKIPVFYYYRDQQNKDVHQIRMIYYLSNISKADYEFFKLIIEIRKNNMIFEDFEGIVPPEVKRSKNQLYVYNEEKFKLNDKGIDVINFMKENQHLKCEEELKALDTYELIKYHIMCFKMWMVSQNG